MDAASPRTIPPSLRPAGALLLAALLAACATPRTTPPQVPQPAPPVSPPASQPPAAEPTPPAPTRMRTHPRFAPPPGGDSYWDTQLGVYVLETVPHTYYRERVYYRWDGAGWSAASGLQGPWQAIDSSGVPAGLSRRVGH